MRYYVIGILFLFCSSLSAARVTYDKYLSLTPKERQGLVKKHIKTKGDFYYVKIGTYEVYCDESPELTLKMAILMDDFFIRFKKIFKKDFRKKNRPLLYVCKDKASYSRTFQKFSGRPAVSWSAGLYTTYKGGALFGNYEYKDQCIETLRHEGTHQLLDFYINGSIPTWFNEGTATNFETWNMTRTVPNNISNNLHVSEYPRVISRIYPSKGYIPLSQLMTITGQQWSATNDPSNQYASSWAAVHYLLSSKKGQSLYNKLIAACRGGKKQTTVLKGSLVKKLEKEIKNHIETVILPHYRYARKINSQIKGGQYAKIKTMCSNYLKNHPKSPEAQFYDVWSDILNKNKEEEQIKTLRNLKRKGYDHPEYDYVLAQAQFLTEAYSSAKRSAKLAIGHYSRHDHAKDLVAQIQEIEKQIRMKKFKGSSK